MSKRPRGLVTSWKPRPATLALLAQVAAVLVEYAAYLPLTVRQLFYRLVGGYDYAKTERAYENLGEMLSKARRAGLVDWDAIRDDGLTRLDGYGWTSKAAMLRYWRRSAEHFHLDRQTGQPRRIYLWCEAAGMAPQLQRVTEGYDIPILSSSGFDSTTVRRDFALELAELDDPAVVLHIGDHDPSGVHCFSALEGDVKAFLGDKADSVDFKRLAVTPTQAEDEHLPTKPAKGTDRRSFSGIGGDRNATVQAEALKPDILARIVLAAVENLVDQDMRAAAVLREQEIRAELVEMMARFG